MLNSFKNLFATLVVAVFVVACGGSSEPDAVAKDFFTDLYNGKADTSKVYLGKNANEPGAQEMVEGKVKAGAAKAKAQADAKGGLDSVQTVDVKTEGNRSTVNLEFTFKDGSKSKERVKLFNEDGDWKVSLR